MILSREGIEVLKECEQFRSVPYNDGGGDGNVNTIGYGHFIRPKESFTVITPEAAAVLLEEDVSKHEDCVATVCKGLDISQPQFDAMVMLCYNIGCRAFSTSTLVKKLQANDMVGARNEFKRWNKEKKGGQYVVAHGLIKRRYVERLVWSGDYVEATKVAEGAKWDYNESLL